MNDIIQPTKGNTTSTVSPNTLDLKTPEQKEADRRAAEERAARVAAQGSNVVNSVDGMMPNTAVTESAPVAGSTMTMEAPKTEPKVVPIPPTPEPTLDSGPSVFKLPEDQVEQKQAMPDQASVVPADQASVAEGTNSAQPQPVSQKKLGFFKRLFGGGKKQEPAPQPEKSQNPEQPQ